MSVYQRGEVWWVAVTTQSGRVRRSAGTKDQALALEQQLMGNPEVFVNRLDWMLNYTMRTRWSVTLSEGHRPRYQKEVDRLNLKFGHQVVTNAIFYQLLSFYREEGYSDGTIRDLLIRVQTAVNHCRDEGFEAPLVSVKKILKGLAPKAYRTATIAKGTEERILGYLKESRTFRAIDLHDFFKVLFTLGSRKGETLDLRVRDFDATSRTITFPGPITKMKTPKVLPAETVFEIFERLTKGKQPGDLVFNLHTNTIRASWKRIRKALGVDHPEFVIHSIRHTVGTNLVRTSGLVAAQLTLGHSDVKTTMRYTHLDLEDLRKAQKLL